MRFLPFIIISEDELQNIEMAEEDRLKERLDLKTKKRDYTGYDDDEFVEGNQGLMKRSILAKYDEDIEGPRHSVSRRIFNFLAKYSRSTRNLGWVIPPFQTNSSRMRNGTRLLRFLINPPSRLTTLVGPSSP
jgi:hypothetical protein